MTTTTQTATKETTMTTRTTARQYTIDAGWDFTSIEATARLGVSDEDVRILATTDVTPDELLDYCREQVASAAK